MFLNKHIIFIGLCLLSISSIFAQGQLEGQIKDANTETPLAFVNVVFLNSQKGTSSDIDGKFTLKYKNIQQQLVFSSIAYKRDTFRISELIAVDGMVFLKKSDHRLREVNVRPGINPAHRIIEAAIANKEKNNPEKATEFYYESYNKLIFTARPDSSILKVPDSTLKRIDSSAYSKLQLLDKQHFFMMESVTERNHIPPTHSKEVVVASKISGFKKPIFSLIGTQLQSFSLYSDYIQLLGTAFLSPLRKGSPNKYLFVLEDTLIRGEDSVFTISYQPRKGKFFDGLKGIITINTDGFAVENFTARSVGDRLEDLEVFIQQRYEKVNDEQWFPVQLNTELIFKSFDIENFTFYAEGKSYLQNIALSSKLNKKEMGNVVLKMQDEAGSKDSSYWANHRLKPLNEREMRTYHLLDSIGEEVNLDKKIKFYQSLFSGAFPIGPVDILLKDLMTYNGYEGFRLGLGAETNQKVSKYFRLGGYGAYGFKDQAAKYGAHLKLNPQWETHTQLKLSYANDVIESGGTQFYNDWRNPFSTESFQLLLIRQMDKVERYEAALESNLLRDFQFTFFAKVENRAITTDYRFEEENNGKYFRMAAAGVGFRWAFREKFIEMFGVKTPISYEYPIVHLKYTHGFNDVLDGDYEYNRIDLKVEKQLRLRNLGVSNFQLRTGYIDNPIPLTTMYRAKGSLHPDLRIAVDNSFQTIAPNTFFHDRYLSFFYKHSFKNLLFKSEFFKPELALTTAVGWGEMSSKNKHKNQSFNTMEKGFFESGIQIDRLLGFLNLGIGAYYRYGAYHLPKFEDNIFYKATYAIRF